MDILTLTTTEASQLHAQEQIIERGLKTFAPVGLSWPLARLSSGVCASGPYLRLYAPAVLSFTVMVYGGLITSGTNGTKTLRRRNSSIISADSSA